MSPFFPSKLIHRLIAILFYSLFGLSFVKGQIPIVEWQSSFGGTNWDDAFSVIQTADAGFLVAGSTNSTDFDIPLNHGGMDYWVQKLDSEGAVEWSKTYGGSLDDFCYAMTLSHDGGFILAGVSYSVDGDITDPHGLGDIWIVKLDALGTILWEKSLGGTHTEYPVDIIQDSDDNYICIGNTYSNDLDVTEHHGTTSSCDSWIVNISDAGILNWQHAYGSDNNDYSAAIVEIEDVGYMVSCAAGGGSGDVSSFNGGSSDFWVLNLNTKGDLLWEKCFGGTDLDAATDIVMDNDGNFIISGGTYSDDGDVTGFHGGATDCWVVKVDVEGNPIWMRCYGGSGSEFAYDAMLTTENTYAICAETQSSDGDITVAYGSADFWTFNLDLTGGIIWQKSLGGSDLEQPYSIFQTLDSNFILGGRSKSSDYDVTENKGDFDRWIIKLKICSTVYFNDFDGDGFGDLAIDSIACTAPTGFVPDSSDCNDLSNIIFPGAIEICNDLDDNCDGNIDNGLTYIHYFQDLDGDMYGNIHIDSLACSPLIGFTEDSTDCDDTDAAVHPGAGEILNGYDDDCDSLIDEGLSIHEMLVSSVLIYPNPADQFLFIMLELKGACDIEIIMLTGQIIFSSKMNSHINEVDISEFASGIYFVTVRTSSGEVNIPFIKK